MLKGPPESTLQKCNGAGKRDVRHPIGRRSRHALRNARIWRRLSIQSLLAKRHRHLESLCRTNGIKSTFNTVSLLCYPLDGSRVTISTETECNACRNSLPKKFSRCSQCNLQVHNTCAQIGSPCEIPRYGSHSNAIVGQVPGNGSREQVSSNTAFMRSS